MKAEDIAASLSEAQRRALLWLPADGTARDHEFRSPREVSFYALAKVIKGDPKREVASIYSLCWLGRNEDRKRGIWPMPTWGATPLGLAVRSHLLKERGEP